MAKYNKIIKDEEIKGLKTLMVIYFLSWIILGLPFALLSIIAWVVLLMVGAVITKIFMGIIKRQNEPTR